MSEVIREMTKRVQNAERKTSALLSSAARSERFRKVEEEKRDAERYWSQMEREAQTLEETREILKNKRNDLKKKRREMEVLVNEEIPKLKNALSLYAHVTKIAWKYEQKARIQGRVNNTTNGEVKSIDAKFPRTEEDRFRLCNSLWELID
jgi:kinetochore protein Spc24